MVALTPVRGISSYRCPLGETGNLPPTLLEFLISRSGGACCGRWTMVEAAVHIVDGERARGGMRGGMSQFRWVPVHTVGSCSLARGRYPRPLGVR